MKIDKKKPALVTGATGYLAGWLVKQLLENGIAVHAAVRNPDNKEKVQHLLDMAESNGGTIKFFKADLLEKGSYDEGMKDCELVFHTASPFILGVKDNRKDLIEPALHGTQNVLDSVNKTDTVKRVVLTSSCAAIYGDAVDLKETPNAEFTEEVWNTSSNENHQAYSYSKLLAEKEAWKMQKEQSRWDLVAINPSLIIGPGTNPRATSASFDIMKQMGSGMMKMGAPEMNIGAVDVRDVANAHFLAAYTEEAKGRHIVSKETIKFLDLADMLRPNFGDQYALPKKNLPKWFLWLMGPAAGMSRKEISRNIGHPWRANNSKGIKELGLSYRPLDIAINEMFQQLIDSNQLK